MAQSTATNQRLRERLEEHEQINRKLEASNRHLQATLKNQQGELKNYAARVARLEERDEGLNETISSLQTNDRDTHETMLQMRAAISESTQAMRDTQKTLAQFTLHTLNPSDTKQESLCQSPSGRQATGTPQPHHPSTACVK